MLELPFELFARVILALLPDVGEKIATAFPRADEQSCRWGSGGIVPTGKGDIIEKVVPMKFPLSQSDTIYTNKFPLSQSDTNIYKLWFIVIFLKAASEIRNRWPGWASRCLSA
jgi:hypothetical protein